MLGEVIGDVLPQAIGIALSPIPIIAAILMLLSPRAGRTAPAFAVGWVAGILVVALAVVLFVPASAAAGQGGGGTAVALVKLVLGLLFLVMALAQWRRRPAPGEAAALPKWMAGVDAMSPGAALGVGAALSALNPKNLSLALAAGLSMARLDGGDAAVALTVFVLLAASSVLVPVVVYALFSARMQAPLGRLKDWLTRNNATVMFVVLLVLGATLVGKALAAF
ncbi:GAP family protein [Glycomyces paridis]|uniref:GAP family protein n=1 Tax=Glycomyces paridis TaxID=2126555 RepID=A0A4S8PL73_9ACTN|nr:GAP family protein [Glycomyces paridis]THV30841.1 GAP family protein [Glycomyces paridis]